MKHEMHINDEETPVLEFDRTLTISNLRRAKLRGDPIYDVRSHCGVLLDRTPFYDEAVTLARKTHKARVFEKRKGIDKMIFESESRMGRNTMSIKE